jgi:PAS domain S-box-containing protein
MHRLLLRQIKKYFPDPDNIDPAMMPFLEAISASYMHSDSTLQLLEHAMLLSNDELKEEKEKVRFQGEQNMAVMKSMIVSLQTLSLDHQEGEGLDTLKLADILKNEIEKRHEAEFKSESVASYMNKMASDLHLALIEFDTEGKIIHANQSSEELFGCDCAQLIQFVEYEKIVPFQLSNTRSESTPARNHAFETTIQRADGSEHWVLCSTSTLLNFDGNTIGSLVALFDIHDRKMKEEELQTARLKAEVALDSRKVFLANISHEIRTPINAIVGMSGLLQQGELSPNQKEYVEALKSSAEGLMVLINDLLDVSKVESGKMDLEIISFSLQKLSKNLIKSLGLKAEEKGLQLNWFMDPQVSEWHLGDPTRISQIITNLIGNAIKFTRSGYVKLKISLIQQTDTNQTLQITVADSGIGIATDRLPGIFEQFTQEDSSTTRKYGGTGLGLSISKQLVELMGSELKVKSEKGKGSEFYFILDLPVSSANQSETDLHEVPDLSGVDVLLVEDNEINRFLALTIFKNWNANIVAVNNGLEAVEELKLNAYHLVLMDLQMPYMDGFEATRIIRQELKLNLPVIALTANSLNTERESCLQHGMNDYVTKPFQPDQLYRKIRTYLANVRYMKRREKHKAG